MTRAERRGKWLFLILATLIIVEKLSGVVLTFSNGLANVNWFKSVIMPVAFAATVACLWYGDELIRKLTGFYFVLSGGWTMFICAWSVVKLAERIEPMNSELFVQFIGIPFGAVFLFGLLHLTAGLLFLFSRSIRAFFRYQREGPLEGLGGT